MKLFAIIAVSLIGLIGCTSTGGVSAIEDLSESRFSILTRVVETGTKFGISQLISSGTVDAEGRAVLSDVSTSLRGVVTQPASETVGTIISDTLERIESLQQYSNSSVIMTAVRFAENYILQRGGFGVIETESGTFILSERSQALILVIADGIDAALDQDVGEGMRSRGIMSFDTNDVMEASFRRAEVEVTRGAGLN